MSPVAWGSKRKVANQRETRNPTWMGYITRHQSRGLLAIQYEEGRGGGWGGAANTFCCQATRSSPASRSRALVLAATGVQMLTAHKLQSAATLSPPPQDFPHPAGPSTCLNLNSRRATRHPVDSSCAALGSKSIGAFFFIHLFPHLLGKNKQD